MIKNYEKIVFNYVNLTDPLSFEIGFADIIHSLNVDFKLGWGNLLMLKSPADLMLGNRPLTF